MKEDKKLCLNVTDLRRIAQVNKIALKLKEMEEILKIRKEENNEMKKEELMMLCRDVNDIHDCGMCHYEFTDTCLQKLEEIKNELRKIRKEEKEMKEKRDFIFSDIYVAHDKNGNQYLYTITRKNKKRAFVKLIDKKTNKMIRRTFDDDVDKIVVRCNGYKYNFINDTKNPKNTTIELVLFGVDEIII